MGLSFSLMTSVVNCGALAPEWRFWDSLWRQKISGALRKIFKNSILPVLVLENFGENIEIRNFGEIVT